MFEVCETLDALNKARSDAIKNGARPQEVNAAYTLNRKRIMQRARTYTPIEVHRPPTDEIVPMVYLPYAGKSMKPNTIEIVERGILC